MIHERGFTLACLRNLMVMAPCWSIFECVDKASCAAYEEPHRPCWRVRQQRGTLCPGPCQRCAVYLNRDYQARRVLEPAGDQQPMAREE